MQVQFIGPLGKVTGSCTWMRDVDRGWSFLVDCGLQQGESTAEQWNSGECWPFDPKTLQFMVLTHAHADHCGLIPLLYKAGFNGTVFCTTETREIAKIALEDSVRFAGGAYDMRDVDRIKWHTPGHVTAFGGYHPVDDDLFIRFFRSGHILGAASVTVVWGAPGPEQRSIAFSGDIGPGTEDQEVLPFLRFRQKPAPATYSVLESTYGDVVRREEVKSPEVRRERLRDVFDHIINHGSTAAICAFAIGRTQDVLFDCHQVVAENPEKYGAIDFYLDSPSGQKINEVTRTALNAQQTIATSGKVRFKWLGKQVFRALGLDDRNRDDIDAAISIAEMTFSNRARQVSDAGTPFIARGNTIARAWRSLFTMVTDRRKLINEVSSKPRVVLMSSGMCDGGPAAQWLPALSRYEHNVIAPSGYCGRGTIGGELLTLANCPLEQRVLRLDAITWTNQGEEVAEVPVSEIRARVMKLEGYSAHGDQVDLVNWQLPVTKTGEQGQTSPCVFLQHGENRQRRTLAKALIARSNDLNLSLEVITPSDPSVWYDLEGSGAGPGWAIRA